MAADTQFGHIHSQPVNALTERGGHRLLEFLGGDNAGRGQPAVLPHDLQHCRHTQRFENGLQHQTVFTERQFFTLRPAGEW